MDATIHALAARVRNTRSAAASTDQPLPAGPTCRRTYPMIQPRTCEIRLIAAFGGGLRGKRHDCRSRRSGHLATPHWLLHFAGIECETCVCRTVVVVHQIWRRGRGALVVGRCFMFQMFQRARFGCVLADSGYGSSGSFRQALSERGLLWAAGLSRRQNVCFADIALIFPVAKAEGPASTTSRSTPGRCRSAVGWREMANG